MTTVGCMALSPMIASIVVYNTQGRNLTHREAMGMGADCIVPFLGSLIVNAAFDDPGTLINPSRVVQGTGETHFFLSDSNRASSGSPVSGWPAESWNLRIAARVVGPTVP